ncbi:asparagine synthase (glutamine-hydrolyzing) [Anaeromyxobacter sp. Fw109-5]|uniref:asparagine synthase (glutamine-hydrolyzing) n=1 Tax=Anaeromyxobacter sp. (strain Fw109-5) TaxID=404589 RepID=UPI0000ED8151|nr:asparagine synthase (glutamine-hydrolyzing) [Anaeromyxobacter sp. Fw109-5]ABS25455.1 asparagine synthase (glutamine-hydrolyzing) [Anaeromyxobacter sp. Fw109-5]
MCGIAGCVALRDGLPPPALEDLRAMVGAIRHRGPDELGLYRDRRAGLGHARLSIIDLATGQQPLSNEDGSLWVVFNGEIFNYLELRAELVALGHRFRTRSDTEVIVHAYEAWAERAFERFNGQFAIALWSSAREALVLARDRLGVRPMYLCEHGGRLWFASEVKALFAGDPDIPRALDPAGLAETFTFWTAVAPQSVFQGVTELEPGHVRTISRAGTDDRAFWTPRYTEPEGSGESPDQAAERVRAALEESVRLRMLRADVPVGSYLSGGLDSSLVAALGRRVKGEKFCTFSLRFEDAEYDETPFQRAVAARLETEHREVLVRREDIAAVFPDVVAHAERPLLRTAPAPLFLLSKLVRDAGIKVVLTGEGADEVFAGYDLFKEGKVRRFWGRQPASRLRPRLLERLYPYLARSPVAQQALAREFFGAGRERWDSAGFAHQTRWRSAAALQRLFCADVRREAQRVDVVDRLLASLPAEFPRWPHLAQDQFLEVRTLLSGYLLSSQGDRMLMAHSVEGRFPFLDPNVVELANGLPATLKLRGLDEKHVLKRAARGLVPDEIVRRSKQPFRAPDALCFVGPGAPDWVGELTSPRAVADAGVFDPRGVERLWRKCEASGGGAQFSNADNMALVGVLSTGLLHERLVRRAPARAAAMDFATVVDRVPARAGGPDARGARGM